MCGISAQLSPVPGGAGIQILQADGFDLHSFHTLTGTTFMMVTEPNTQESAEILRTTYGITKMNLHKSIYISKKKSTSARFTFDLSCLLMCRVYDLFCDYVQKNPFHESDQVVKSELFDTNLVKALTAMNRRWAAMQT